MSLKVKFFYGFFLSLLLVSYFCYQETRQILSTPVSAWSSHVFADCAIVLTGSEGRVQKGFDLLSQKRVKKLIISGVYVNSDLKEIFPQWPFYPNVSEDDITLEKRSLTTYGNARQSLPLAEALKCRDVVLITTSLHMRRAFRIFKETFPEEMQIYKYAIVSKQYKPSFWRLSVEVVKSLFYSLWAY